MGAFPVQAEGFVNGNPFYFRLRFGRWELTVTTPEDSPVVWSDGRNVLLYVSDYWDDPNPWCGDAEPETVKQFIIHQISKFGLTPN